MTDDDVPLPWMKPHGRPWSHRGEPRRLHDNPWFAVEQYDATAPTGAPAQYYVQRFKNVATGVMPLHEDGTVTLVGQWRFPHGDFVWEIPEGGAPMGETPLEGARRELAEEAGLEAAHWREILRMQLSNAASDEVALGFLATGLTSCPIAPEATEELAVARVPFREALHAAVTGRIVDSISVAMLLRLHHMAVEGELDAALCARLLAR